MQRIVCAAIRKSGIVVCGARHFDMVMRVTIDNMKYPDGYWSDAEQGFIDNRGKFLDRYEAYIIAENANQLFRKPDDSYKFPRRLYSENLY